MHPLNLRMVSRPTNAREPNRYPQRQEPEMQTGWEGRGRRIVEKDRSVIKRDLAWETRREKRAPQCQVLGFERRIGGVATGIALHLEAADDSKDGDQVECLVIEGLSNIFSGR